MKKKLVFAFAAMVAFASVNAQVKWSADPAHTDVQFSVKHLGISFIDGDFTKVAGNVETKDTASFNDAKIEFTIQTASIDTRVEMRNNHLKSDDFFNAEKFPTIKLSSVSFKKVSGDKYKLIANLTIRDVTKQVVFTATQNGIITDPWGKKRAGFTATTTVNRHDFGLKYNDKLPSGVEAVASMVSIVVNTELIKN